MVDDSNKPTAQARDTTATRLPLTPVVLDEYISIRESASRLSDRRDRATEVFTGINALFLSGLGLLVISSHFTSWEVVLETAAITVAVFPVNWAWYSTLGVYKRGIDKHYETLEEIEKNFDLAGNLSTKLAKASTVSRSGSSGTGVSLARYFLVLYLLITVGVFIVTLLMTHQ